MLSLSPITGTLGATRAAHLLRRLTFGPTKAEIDAFATKTIAQAITDLFQPRPIPPPPKDHLTGSEWVTTGATTGVNSISNHLKHYIRAWWFAQMMDAGANATEKCVFFLHTNFTVQSSIVNNSVDLYYQNQLLRTYCFGDIRELTEKISLDSAMIVFLDGNTNKRTSPNENYARELFELYTIGKGIEAGPGDYTTYTEDDVQAAARVLTGYAKDITNIDPDTGFPTARIRTNQNGSTNEHDYDPKVFSTAYNGHTIQPAAFDAYGFATEAAMRDELTDLIHMIFAKFETAQNICRKIYRFFVYYDITADVETNIIDVLANTLVANNFNLQPVYELLFSSEHFFDEDTPDLSDNVLGALIKSPAEVTIGTLRFFNVDLLPWDVNTQAELYAYYEETFRLSLRKYMEAQGMSLLNPPEVAGYPAYHQGPSYPRNWISSNTLAERYNLIPLLVEGYTANSTLYYKLDIVDFVENHISNPFDAEVLVDELIAYVFPVLVSQERRDYFLYDVLLDGLQLYNWTNAWVQYTSSQDDSAIRPSLEILINGLLQSPEYQLS